MGRPTQRDLLRHVGGGDVEDGHPSDVLDAERVDFGDVATQREGGVDLAAACAASWMRAQRLVMSCCGAPASLDAATQPARPRSLDAHENG